VKGTTNNNFSGFGLNEYSFPFIIPSLTRVEFGNFIAFCAAQAYFKQQKNHVLLKPDCYER